MTGTTGARGAKRGHGLRLYLERVTGIEPALSAWEADVLPLNYTRVAAQAARRA